MGDMRFCIPSMEEKVDYVLSSVFLCMFVGTEVFWNHRLLVDGSQLLLYFAYKALNDIHISRVRGKVSVRGVHATVGCDLICYNAHK